MRLAYEDLSLRQKKEEDKMKASDPQKAKQIERLGMGFGHRSWVFLSPENIWVYDQNVSVLMICRFYRGISHSALSEMKTIHQENASRNYDTLKSMDSSHESFYDGLDGLDFLTTGASFMDLKNKL